MKNIIFSILLIFGAAFLLPGCRNTKAKNNTESLAPLKMVEVPAMITDPAERSKYIITHFWDQMNFHDTVYISNAENLNVHFSAYLDYLSQSKREDVWSSVAKLTDSVLNSDPKILARFREMFESSLYHPNSIYRNEELYISILEKFTKSDKFSEIDKATLQQQLDLAYRNRLGTKAIDFKFYLKDGSVKSLYGIKSDYVILMFIDPDCPTCKSVMEEMKASNILSGFKNRVTVLTMYAGVETERWCSEASKLNDKWINGCDKDMKIMDGPQYDLRPTPSLYLLDKQKTVLLKDAPFKSIEEYLSNIR